VVCLPVRYNHKAKVNVMNVKLSDSFEKARRRTEDICAPLEMEDFVVQPVDFVSPPKWHIGHTTWFFETFILKPFRENYREFDAYYNFIFNSYYESVGIRVIRTHRGNLSRPTVADVYHYREYVDFHMKDLLSQESTEQIINLVILGINHEEQHQELLLTDIKYILGHNPLFPAYSAGYGTPAWKQSNFPSIGMEAGLYDIGHAEEGFSFDNELTRHKVYLDAFEISPDLVTNGEYLGFIEAGGYRNFSYWHAAGWDWVNNTQTNSPLYWHKIDGQWKVYTLGGLQPLDLSLPFPTSATTKHGPTLHGRATGYPQRLNGRRPPTASTGAADGNGPKALICLIRDFQKLRVRLANITANLW
jgi:ergothioneine biosynthesis protein EgtB